MPRKGNKGRGRGRGRGRGSHDEPRIGQEKSKVQDEPKRPGARSEEKKAQEEKPAGQETPAQPAKPVQPQKPTGQGATNVESVCDTLGNISIHDDKQLSEASYHQTRQQQGDGRHRRAKRGNQYSSEEEGAAVKPTITPMLPPQRVSCHNQTQVQGSSEVAVMTNTPLSANKSQPPQGNGSGSAPNGKQVVASAMSEEKPSHLKQQIQLLPRRPGYGDQGRRIRLKANFFKLDFRGVDFLYHYDIEIKPDKTPVSLCRKVVNAAVEKYLGKYFDNHRPAFDGKRNLYSRKKLPSINGNGCELDVKLPGEDGGPERQFKLTVKYAAEVRVEDLNQFLREEGKAVPEAVQALDIVLRQIPSLYFTSVGRSFFPPSQQGFPLGGGCEVRTGFYQSTRPSQWKTMLVNIDVSSKGFMKAQPVINLLCEMFKLDEDRISQFKMNRYQEKEFVDAIKGFKVETNHIPGKKRKYLVNGLGKNAFDHKFPLDSEDNQARNSRMISVRDYFRETYNIDLRYPHLPCLVVGQKKNHLPMEVCEMVESQKRKLTDDQTAIMIKKVTRPARERQRDIESWAEDLQGDSANYLQKEFGLSVDKRMVDVEGRVLPAPTVSLGDDGTIVPRDGVWDMRDKKFFKGATVNMWAMVCFVDPRRCGDDVTRKFANVMANVCRKEGMQMNGRPCRVEYARTNDNVEQILSNLVFNFKDIELILVVLPPQGNKEIYKEVKRVGDTILGIPTQCVQTKQFTAAKPQVCSNIAMKINAKLGGINHSIAPSFMPSLFSKVIVFGADVTHPSPGESNIPSLAAVVASVDPHASKYAARVRAQTHMKDKSAQEIILEMRVMVKELLIEFYNATGKTKPERIIFYRDGVSEGQFDQVLVNEVKAVQQACLDLQKDGKYQPAITFIVVQKRHHARLFCADKKDESGRAGNVPPGTMVDRGITHPYEFDFYLCSHQGIQGTSRPTHYHVLYDDNNLDANTLQRLTYHLCHTYARCTRSVSMPAPAYYAHLVAFRARHHLNGLVSNTGNKKDAELLEEFRKAIEVNKKMIKTMYFA